MLHATRCALFAALGSIATAQAAPVWAAWPTVPVLAFQSAVPAQRSVAPALQSRSAEDDDEATAIDKRVLAPVTIAPDASGRYDFNHDRDSVEVDFDREGLTGYVSVEETRARRAEPLTYFFAKSTTAGSHIYFITHQVHRVRYEFDGDVIDRPAEGGGLARDYTLRGTLTTHQAQPGGQDQVQSRTVTFRRFRYFR